MIERYRAVARDSPANRHGGKPIAGAADHNRRPGGGPHCRPRDSLRFNTG